MSQQDQTKCSQCGAENRPGARFCAKCQKPLTVAGSPAGAPWTPPSPPPPPAAPYRPLPTRNNRRMTFLLVGIGLGVTVLLIVLAIVLMLPNDEKETGVAAGTGTPAGIITPTATTLLPLSPTPTLTATPLAVTATPAISLSATLPPAPVGNNLLQNGNFSERWDVGWQRLGSPTILNQVTENQPMAEAASGQGLYLRRTGPGFLQLGQTVTVVPSQLLLTGQLRATGSGTITGDEGTAGLMLIYKRTDTTPIAWSIWLNGADLISHNFPTEGNFPPAGPNSTFHGIGEGWYLLNVNLADEFFSRFPDIPFEQVAQIEVILFSAGTAGCQANDCQAELWATDLALIQN